MFKALSTYNVVDMNCRCCTFTHSGDINPQVLVIDATVSDTTALRFVDANGRVHIHTLVIGRNGSLRTVLQNFWKGDGQNGYYSLLHEAKVVVIRDNPKALEDMLNCVTSGYTLAKQWKQQQLHNIIGVRVEFTERVSPSTEQCINKLMKYTTVTRVQEAVVCNLESESEITQDASRCILRAGRNKQCKRLLINCKLESEVPLEFHNVRNKMCVSELSIGPRGKFQSVLRNYWQSRKRRKCGYYSLVFHTEVLKIDNNSQFLYDLVSYMERICQLDEYYQQRKLCKNIKLMVKCAETDLSVIKQLQQYFKTVMVQRFEVPLRADNVVDVDCDEYIFVQNGAVVPQSITVNAAVGMVCFRGTNSEVYFKNVTIGPQGNLDSILCNAYQQGADVRNVKLYRILGNVVILKINGNLTALQSLVECVKKAYPLREDMEVITNGMYNCDTEIAALMGYLVNVTVIGGEVLDKIQCCTTPLCTEDSNRSNGI